jgi:predicted RNA-binding protein YlqC (UPF0109 family)
MTDERDAVLEDQDDIQELDAGEADVDDTQAVNELAVSGDLDEATESLRELTSYLVYNLVDEPDTVDISVERRGPSVHIQLRLPEGELGKVIGRGGRIAKAMRTVLLIAGSKHHLRVSLDIES